MRNVRFESPLWRSTLVLLLVATGARAGEQREIHGRVVDEKGQPVADASVADFWRANGTGKDQNGKYLDMKIEANVKKFWSHLGEMEPAGRLKIATSGSEGEFTVALPTSSHALLAMDRQRQRAGLLIIPKGKEQESMEIRLGPVIKLRGSFQGPGAGEKPGWTHVYLNPPGDPTRPLDSTRLVSCGSFEARFEMSLPPGRYVLHGYNDALDAFLSLDKEIELVAGQPEVDLGVLMLSSTRSATSTKIERSKSSGSWIDVASRYGKPAPAWHITDARGVSKDAQIKDFKGKWLLVYFWGFGCAPCLRSGLPSVAQFYEEHSAERNRFEVVALCVDDDGELNSMAAVDRQLEPVVKHVWGGKALPIPVVLDASFQTLENFGISTFGPQLIDPDGNLIKGDETVLAEKLKHVRPTP